MDRYNSAISEKKIQMAMAIIAYAL